LEKSIQFAAESVLELEPSAEAGCQKICAIFLTVPSENPCVGGSIPHWPPDNNFWR